MKNIYLYLLLISILFSTNARAQWDTITSFNQIINDLKSFDGKLFIGGAFMEEAGNTCYWSAYYDGSSITRQTNVIGGSGISRFEIFNNELYTAGSMITGSSFGVSKWDGTTWKNEGTFNKSHTGIYSDNDSLYVGDDFGVLSVRGLSGGYTQYPALVGFNSFIKGITKYNGEIIAGGGFDSSGANALNKIARWDGNAWAPLGSGLSGGFYANRFGVMTVYKDELHVGGTFTNAGGTEITWLAKWDGAIWSDVGGSLTVYGGNGIRDMIVYQNELYIAGDFSEVGGVSANNVAKWDGTKWEALSLDHNDDFVNCIEVYEGDLYVGTFDFDTSHLYRYPLSGNSMKDPVNNEIVKFRLYPNPVRDQINIYFETGDQSNVLVDITDILGRSIITEKIETSNIHNIVYNCSNWEKGVYLVTLRNTDSQIILKRDKFIVR